MCHILHILIGEDIDVITFYFFWLFTCEQSVCVDKKNDTVAGRYEFHFLMFITIFYSLALLIRKNNMLLLTRK